MDSDFKNVLFLNTRRFELFVTLSLSRLNDHYKSKLLFTVIDIYSICLYGMANRLKANFVLTNNLDAQQTEELYTNERIYTYVPRLVRMQLDFAREHLAFRLHDFEFVYSYSYCTYLIY